MKKQKEFPLDIKISFHKIILRISKATGEGTSKISREYIEKHAGLCFLFSCTFEEGIEDAEELNETKRSNQDPHERSVS